LSQTSSVLLRQQSIGSRVSGLLCSLFRIYPVLICGSNSSIQGVNKLINSVLFRGCGAAIEKGGGSHSNPQ
jgi:hypothetical protein